MEIQTDLQNWLVVIVGGGLIIKIVWDWLKNRGRSETFKTCPLHDGMQKTIESLEGCLIALKTRYVDRDEFKDSMREIADKIDTLHDRITQTATAFDRAITDLRVLITRIETIQETSARNKSNPAADG